MKRCLEACRILTLIVVLFAAVTSMVAYAEEKAEPKADRSSGWYLGASVGGQFPGGLSNQPFTVQNAGLTATINQGFNLGNSWLVAGQAGYRFDGPRVEGEFIYSSYSRPSTPVVVTAGNTVLLNTSVPSDRISSYSAMVNGLYDFKTKSQFTPYVGGGLGITWLDSGSRSSTGFIVQTPGLKRSVLGYQAKAGVAYNMSDWTSLFLQYRYMGTGSFSYGGATVGLGGTTFNIPSRSGSLSNHSIEIGVQIRP